MKTFIAFLVLLFCTVGTSVSASVVTETLSVAETTKPSEPKQKSTTTDFDPPFITQIVSIAFHGFQQGKYQLVNAATKSNFIEFDFVAEGLPVIRYAISTNNFRSVEMQVDLYYIKIYDGQLISVQHVPSGSYTTAAANILAALRQEIDNAVGKWLRTPEITTTQRET